MSTADQLKQFVKKIFKTTLDVFLQALKMSPNAQGYIGGSVTELLLMNKIKNEYALEVHRVREKWEGGKHPNHHGDFYFKSRDKWYVAEAKGVKSNSEKWHKLYNIKQLNKFLQTYSHLIPWIDQDASLTHQQEQIVEWLQEELPRFFSEYKDEIYSFAEIKNYNPGSRQTPKSMRIQELRDLSQEQLNGIIDERLAYLMKKVKILETHFVSGTSGVSNRSQATPRWDEFNVICIDIYLRFSEHKFLFANPRNLTPSPSDENHIQQNYIIGFVFNSNSKEVPILVLEEEWHENFNDVLLTLDHQYAINEQDMQIDNRFLTASIEEK